MPSYEILDLVNGWVWRLSTNAMPDIDIVVESSNNTVCPACIMFIYPFHSTVPFCFFTRDSSLRQCKRVECVVNGVTGVGKKASKRDDIFRTGVLVGLAIVGVRR
jgi:hypothetical protein